MYLVSDLHNGTYSVTAKFFGKNAQESAIRWAGSKGKVTRLRSTAIYFAIKLGQSLPARYK